FMTRIEKVNRLYEFSHDFLSELFVIVAKQHKYMFDLYKTTPDSVKVVPEYISTVNDYLSNLNSIRLTDIKLLAEINKKHLLETELILKQFVNLIVEEINKLKKHDDKTIEIISQIDDLLNKISSLKNIAGTIDKLFVQKLKECSRYLLAYKRSLLSKDDGSWLELKELRIPFDDDMIEYAQTMINKNIFNVYSFLKLDIDDMMKKAIFAKSQYPLSYTLRNFEIDTKQGVYRTSIKHNDFKKSIEEAGLVLQESLLQDHKEKMPNVFNKGFYSALRETILREHDITLAILEYVVDLRDLSIRLIEQLDLMFDLKLKPSKELFTIPQILLQKVVLIIEQMLSRQSETNIDTYLLNLYKTSDDELKNDAFLLYFILYAHDGYKLRHNISHGNIIDNNYKREMILGLVAFVAMRNTITGAHKNE
ncbi:MAG: hypothetical protein ACOCQD_05540, partial [archaeon]